MSKNDLCILDINSFSNFTRQFVDLFPVRHKVKSTRAIANDKFVATVVLLGQNTYSQILASTSGL